MIHSFFSKVWYPGRRMEDDRRGGMASVLKMPVPFFLRPPSCPEADNLFYRSMSGATKTDRLKARRRYAWLKEITSYLRGYVRFPQVRVPQIDVPGELVAIDTHVIEDAADRTREEWGLGNGPISDVTLLLENKWGHRFKGYSWNNIHGWVFGLGCGIKHTLYHPWR